MVVAVASGCTASRHAAPANFAPTTTTPTPTTTTPTTTTTTTTTAPAAGTVEIDVRLVDRAGVAGFAEAVRATLLDPRGWQRAGFRFVERADAPYEIVLAEPDDAEAMCRPYDVFKKYSCQLGPVVVLNADRWRQATPEWTGDLPAYRQMLVNHEVGHLLGMKHPAVPCPTPGRPARVMSQQSTELRGCLPNPWPLDDEVARAARHDLPLAPGYEPS